MSKNSSLAILGCSALLALAVSGCSTSARDNNVKTPDFSAPPPDARMQFRPDHEGVRITPDGQIDLEGNPELKKRKQHREFDSLYDPLPDFVL